MIILKFYQNIRDKICEKKKNFGKIKGKNRVTSTAPLIIILLFLYACGLILSHNYGFFT